MENQKKSGDFKPSEKFIGFIGAKGNVNFISNEALIDGELLSGLGFEDKTFKLTIYEDGTVDFNDVENQITTKGQREQLLNVITEKTIVSFRKRMVIRELTFTSINEIDGKKVNLYLSVDYDKPINRLASIFDDEIEVTDSQHEKLSVLMSLFDDIENNDDEKNIEEDIVVDKKEIQESDIDVQTIKTFEETLKRYKSDLEKNPSSTFYTGLVKDTEEYIEELKGELKSQKLDENIGKVNKHLEESFKKMKEEKVENLKKDLKHKKTELVKFERDKKFASSKVEEFTADIRLLESRIDSLQTQSEPNGWYFNVSERINEQIVLEKEIYEVIKSKVDKVKGINSEAFMKLFEDGEFQIRFAKKTESGFEELVDLKELDSINLPELTFTLREDKLFYIGEIVWAELANKFLKIGFSQDPEWEKMCDSNSYKLSQELN